ncbi:MAG: TIGR03936 family radical SAM-associated protein [Oscillospiraceae bacterium]|nr:TIGR03936 family radical SAM-associated protein [Oscillospiraceae bacterium]
MEKINLRARFEKSGRAVYISHLDLMRTMQRAFKRSKIPVWYTEGFNPHIYLNFPLALSLGVVGRSEFMDFAVTEPADFDKLRDSLNGEMPEGLRILEIFEPLYENKDVGFADYMIDFYSSADSCETLFLLNKMLAEDKIEVDKRSKSKGMIKTDIKPHINVTETEPCDGFLRVFVRLPAGLKMNINAGVFTDAFAEYSKIEFSKIYAERTKILCLNGQDFK